MTNLIRTELQQQLELGTLSIEQIQSLTLGQAAALVVHLATGNFDQRENLIKLMMNIDFAKILTVALNEMTVADRRRIFQTVGEMQENLVSSVRITLHEALDGMVHSRMDQTLREALSSQDSAAVREANAYLERAPINSVGFLKSLCSDLLLEDKKLNQLFTSMSTLSRNLALQYLAKGQESEIREVFKRLGDAIYDAQQEPMRLILEGGIDSLSDNLRSELLTKIITDMAGNRAADRQVNKAQRLVSAYIDRQDIGNIHKVLNSITDENIEEWGKFLYQQVRNDNVLRLIIKNYLSTNRTNSESMAAQASNEVDSYLSTAKKIGKYAAYMLAGLVALPTSPALGTTLLLKIMQYDNLKIELKSINADLLDLIEGFENDKPRLDSEKRKIRKRIGELLNENKNSMLLYLAPSDLKRIVKVFMHPPADMDQLKFFSVDLSPRFSAKLARAISIAASEVIAETKAGTWAGDILKGLTISGKVGRSSSNKSDGIGISAELGFTWSPAALVDGIRTRELNQFTSELNGFMMDWIGKLNDMAPNQKAVFLEEMKDSVTIKTTS